MTVDRVSIYFEYSRRFHEESIREFEEGVKENNARRIRDSAEKA